MTTERSREARLRRMAERQDMKLIKSRRRDPRAYDFGLYLLADRRTGAAVAGADAGRHTYDLDDVEHFLLHGFDEPTS